MSDNKSNDTGCECKTYEIVRKGYPDADNMLYGRKGEEIETRYIDMEKRAVDEVNDTNNK